MTHTVKSGETLSKIAKANRITLEQLLDANPKFKANPNRLRVGDILNIPDGQAGTTEPTKPPTTTPPKPPTPPQPQPAAGRILGKLSEQFETSGRGPGTVSGGQGDPGGVSYGTYQMTSKPGGGTAKRFVSQPDFPFKSSFAGLAPGTGPFSAVWKSLASTKREEFQSSQHDYIKKTHFDPLVQKIINEDGLNVLTRSHALQDVIWSTAVQHGPGSKIPHRALAGVSLRPEDAGFDKSLIVAIYNERGRKNANGGLVNFPRASPAVQRGVANRFKEESKKALQMLAEETGG
ncbi:MAG: LysM peptidoglycan-binding domain-containing protein [Rubrivivax sp.]|nr:LysM peptidoglycan-binding domain-containing protein [Pyrinomonadaceae bacterium]